MNDKTATIKNPLPSRPDGREKRTTNQTQNNKMTYQFDTPPTRESMIQEFGINADRLHLIETFICSIAASEDDFDSDKDKFTMEESALILKKCNLVEAFALLCSLPWNGWGRLVILSPDRALAMNCGAVRITAVFDKFGKLVRWPEAERLHCPWMIDPWVIEKRSPAALVADEAWMAAHYAEAENAAHQMEEFEYSTDVAAVSMCPLSALQWRRKFVAERWFDPERGISARLIDEEDLAEWNSFVRRPGEALAALSRFEKWAPGRESLDGLPRFD